MKDLGYPFSDILAPIKDIKPRYLLRTKARHLKEMDGESWAVGEMLERACIYLDCLDFEPMQKK